MQPPQFITSIYDRLNHIPVETLTKAWWHQLCGGAPRQRTPEQMAEHHARYGCGGNCFDVAVWNMT